MLIEILTIETKSLGDRSYVVHDGTSAAVIDPQRDIDRVVSVLEASDLDLVAVFETHIHNDYVSGGLELSQRAGVDYRLHGDEATEFDFVPTWDGDVINIGTFTMLAVHTPGHTPSHLSFVVRDGHRDVAVFSGGSLLYGSVGRTDLDSRRSTEELTRLQYRSARHLMSDLHDDVEVWPTHGFGSFCSSSPTTGSDTSTIGLERQHNEVSTTRDEDEFVRAVVAGLDAYPAYYAHMAGINRSGPAQIDLRPADDVDSAELVRRLSAGGWLVDLRDRVAFAREHLAGTVNIELDETASTYLGWLITWGSPVTLLAESEHEIVEMQRQLVRIGIDRPAGQISGGLSGIDASVPRGSYATADFALLRETLRSRRATVVLDVRRGLEWSKGHLDMAWHIPLHELEQRIHEVPEGQVWVHCASGYRASIATSLLARAGRDAVLIDDEFHTDALDRCEIDLG